MSATKPFRCIGLGEVLWDLLPAGKQLGGAPANFAYHAHALGAEALVVSRVGNDALGREILDRLRGLGLRTDGITTAPSVPTGTVSVTLNAQGHPSYTIHENVAWDCITAEETVLALARSADAICFGSLAQRAETSRGTIHHLLRQSPPGAFRVFDINLRQHFYSRSVIEQSLQLANVLKLNETELPVLAAMFELKGDREMQVLALAERFDLKGVALTLGPQGSLLYQDGRWSECGTRPVQVKDTVGAGDAFTAVLVVGLLQKMELDEINFAANEVARHVCSCSGATPPLPESVREILACPKVDSAASSTLAC